MSKGEKGEDFVPIGKIVGAHGIQGRVKLLYFSQHRTFPYTKIYLRETKGIYRCLEVSSILSLKGHFALQLEGIETRTDALSLAGELIYYPRKNFPKIKQDEFYWIDLIGLSVIEASCPQPGRIKGIIETGGTDVIEIICGGKDYLIPFSYTWIEEISIESGRLTLKKGTLEYFDVH